MSVLPEWVQLLDDEDGLVVVELDEAAAHAAPLPDHPVQLVVTVALHDPDEEGQPYAEEHAELAGWREALERALGQDGRLVATITAGGSREHVAYLRSEDVVQAWRDAPPDGLGAYEAQVALVPDPTWLGLREIAGLLADGEEPLVLPL
ncbi:MAG: hypothetical protein JWM62_3016 [Frankiales bacterium]|jgi:hypothetical protein|nr:hypothetical protein [Frankiales bacterium]